MLVLADIFRIDAQTALDCLASFTGVGVYLRLELPPLREGVEDDRAAISEDLGEFARGVGRRIHVDIMIELIVAKAGLVQRTGLSSVQIVLRDTKKRPGGPGLERLEHLAARLVFDVLQDAQIMAQTIFLDHE